MAFDETTLDQLIDMLDQAAPDQPLIFATTQSDIGAGYHVTELKHLAVNSIDCGGRPSAWQEAQLQLLDGRHGAHMSIGKFVAIARRSIAAVEGLGSVSLSIEYAPGNQGLRRYLIADLIPGSDGLRVSLVEDGASCKPQSDMARPNATKKAAPQDRPVKDCCGWS